MAAYNKFDIFVGDVMDKVHDLLGVNDLLKIMLVNSPAPVATNTLKANLTEIAAGNGYTAGGDDTQNSGARATGTFTLTGTKVVWTATASSIGPFRYVVLYNDTPATPLDPLIAWWDHGSAVTLAIDETFTVKFNNGDPTGSILTLV